MLSFVFYKTYLHRVFLQKKLVTVAVLEEENWGTGDSVWEGDIFAAYIFVQLWRKVANQL